MQITITAIPLGGFRHPPGTHSLNSFYKVLQWLSGKEPVGSAGDAGDAGSTPGSEDRLEEGMPNHSSILAWEILWTEEPGGLAESQTQFSN